MLARRNSNNIVYSTSDFRFARSNRFLDYPRGIAETVYPCVALAFTGLLDDVDLMKASRV